MLSFISRLFRGRSQTKPVKFRVTGTATSYNITYKSSNDDAAVQISSVKKGWKHTFSANPGDYVYISAQSNEKGKSVNVEIIYNHKTYQSVGSRGDYALATASGLL